MFRRLLVNASLHNTDDHLRNHAVINTGEGWELSPVFDRRSVSWTEATRLRSWTWIQRRVRPAGGVCLARCLRVG